MAKKLTKKTDGVKRAMAETASVAADASGDAGVADSTPQHSVAHHAPMKKNGVLMKADLPTVDAQGKKIENMGRYCLLHGLKPHKIYRVTAARRKNEPHREPVEFVAHDGGDAIRQYVNHYKIQHAYRYNFSVTHVSDG